MGRTEVEPDERELPLDIGMSNLHDAVHSMPMARRPRVVTLNWSTIRGESGIDQRAELIGSAAIDILAGMIVHSEKGIPATAYTTLVMGSWVSPTSPDLAKRVLRKAKKI